MGPVGYDCVLAPAWSNIDHHKDRLPLRIPLLSHLHELDRPPRKFLLFIVFNVVSWQCIVGPTLILFARKIGMPTRWVGFLMAFMPISTMLVVVTAPLVTRFGPKRIMFTAWLLRNLVSCTVFLMPWAISRWGEASGRYLLFMTTLGFCLMRALGSGGWLPWLHEVVPERQRGVYFSTEASVAQTLNVLVAFGQAMVLSGHSGLSRFLSIYAVGIASGLVSLIWMAQVPGGHGRKKPLSTMNPRKFPGALYVARNDRSYLWFVLTASLCFSSTAWLGSALVLYMRDALMLTSRTIMLLTASGSAAVLLTIHFWARFADHSGSGRAMFKTLTGYSLAALGCVAVVPGAAWSPYLLVFVVLASSVFGSAFWMAAHRAMLNYIRETARIGYSNLWTLGTAVAFGVTPVLAGAVIDRWDLFGFRTCFILSGVAGLTCAWACRRVVRDAPPHLSEEKNSALEPLRTIARILWITAGMHESNRQARP